MDYDDTDAQNVVKMIRKFKRNKKGRGRFLFSNSENLNEAKIGRIRIDVGTREP
jgi:hypothetical protein